MPKVLKTRKMKLKQRIRHRKSRVIKTKSRKNRYRRKTKYKVGGGTLDSKVFNTISGFIQSKSDVETAETEYRRLYLLFSEKVESPCFNPDKMTGVFNKKNRLHDILEKINADTSNTRDVGEPKDYIELSESLEKLQNTDQAIKQGKDQAARDRFLKRQEQERRQQQPQVHSGFATFQQQQDQKYFKVSIDNTKMFPIPEGLQLFGPLGRIVTKIPNNRTVSMCKHEEITKEAYDIITEPEEHYTAAGTLSYKYKRDPHNPEIYYVHHEQGNLEFIALTKLLESPYSGAYEYRMTPQDNCTDPSTEALKIVIEPEVTDDKKDIIRRLWRDANCLLKRYRDIFTKVNPKIMSPSGKSLSYLSIAPDAGKYNQGTFSGNFKDGTTVTVDVYDEAYRKLIKGHRGYGGPD